MIGNLVRFARAVTLALPLVVGTAYVADSTDDKIIRAITPVVEVQEGFRSSPYTDTVGVWTIGYGHTKDVTQDTLPITKQEARELLKQDLRIALAHARVIVEDFDTFSIERQQVIVNMVFNMGPTRFKRFKRTLQALEERNFLMTGVHMTDSKWYTQVTGRAGYLTHQMICNMPPEHDGSYQLKQ